MAFVADLEQLAHLQPFMHAQYCVYSIYSMDLSQFSVDFTATPVPSEDPNKKKYFQTIKEMVPWMFGIKMAVVMSMDITVDASNPSAFFVAEARPPGLQSYLFSMKAVFSVNKISDTEVEFVDSIHGTVCRGFAGLVVKSAAIAHKTLCQRLKQALEANS